MAETKVTADITPFLDALGNGADTHITVGCMGVPKEVTLAFIAAARRGVDAPWPRDAALCSTWPIQAINACTHLNGSNPTAVAGEIVEAFEILKRAVERGNFFDPQDADKADALLQRIQNNGGGDG